MRSEDIAYKKGDLWQVVTSTTLKMMQVFRRAATAGVSSYSAEGFVHLSIRNVGFQGKGGIK